MVYESHEILSKNHSFRRPNTSETFSVRIESVSEKLFRLLRFTFDNAIRQDSMSEDSLRAYLLKLHVNPSIANLGCIFTRLGGVTS